MPFNLNKEWAKVEALNALLTGNVPPYITIDHYGYSREIRVRLRHRLSRTHKGHWIVSYLGFLFHAPKGGKVVLKNARGWAKITEPHPIGWDYEDSVDPARIASWHYDIETYAEDCRPPEEAQETTP